MKPVDSYQEIFSDVQKVTAVFAHPDDCEIICGGLVDRLIKDGKDFQLIVTTNGGKGFKNMKNTTEEKFAKLRIEDSIQAARALGIPSKNIINLNKSDGMFEDNLENIGLIVKEIRKFKPNLVITHNPEEVINTFNDSARWVNHRDHRKTAIATVDACYPYSRDRGFFPEHFKEGLSEHIVTKLLLSDSYTHPNRKYFDITDQINVKRGAISQHKNAIDSSSVEDYLEENKIGNKYFEVLRYVEIY
jgi:LmbE family N-acetylglucosaminyl deacetylase